MTTRYKTYIPGFIRSSKSRIKGVLVIAGACFLLTSCSTSLPPKPQTTLDEQALRDVIFQTIDLVSSRYIDPIGLDQIATGSLSNLSQIDPDIRVTLQPDKLVLAYRHLVLDVLPLPDDHNIIEDNDLWTRLTIQSLHLLQIHSLPLRNASQKRIETALISGAIDNLDPYSRYETPQQTHSARNKRDGYVGIGVQIAQTETYPAITDVSYGSPAAKNALHSGDMILSINEKNTFGLSPEETSALLVGAVGTNVRLTVNSANTTYQRTLTVPRAYIIERTVFPTYRDNILIARISSFNSATADSLRQEILDSLHRTSPISGVVLDLRGNRGGLLQQGVAVANLFLQKGLIARTRSRVRAARHIFEADNTDITGNLPLAILIDGRTASSAELVAASLQDRNRAILIGSTSFGKGAVQAINELSNDGSLIFTWSRIMAPSGYTFDRIGLLPSICTVSITTEKAHHGILTTLENRQRLAETMKEWRSLDFNDETKRRQLRSSCPAESRTEMSDVNVAIELLQNRKEYTDIAQIGQLEIADSQQD